LLERNPDLTEEISSFIEDEAVQRLMTEDSSARIITQNSKQGLKQDLEQASKQDLQQGPKQTLIDRIRVFEEFNRMLEAFVTKNVNSQVPEKFKMPDIEKPDQGLEL